MVHDSSLAHAAGSVSQRPATLGGVDAELDSLVR